LPEAIVACELWLEANPASADAHALLGVIRQAGGDPAGAETCFRRALYLDPEHDEALTHLALLLERRGDRGAGLVRRRARHAREARP
jgi:chemotaxis protein methyltransferase WspC